MNNNQNASYQALIKMTNAITSSLDTDQMMECIVREVVSVLTYAEVGLLYLFDNNTGKLMPQSIVGFPQGYCEMAAFEPGKSLSGKVFLKGKSEIINGMEKCREAIINMPEAQLENYFKYKDSFPYSIMSVPLKVDDNVIGVFTVDNYNYPDQQFTQEDLEILNAAANHVSIVITKSKMINKEKMYRQQLESANIELKKGYDFLEQTLLIHEKLTEIALSGKGFQDILTFVWQMIGQPLEVYDLFLRPLASAGETGGKKLPEEFLELPEMKKVLQKKQWQEIVIKGSNEKIYVFPILGAKKLLGFLAVWTQESMLSDIEFIALNYSSTVLALEWLKQEEVFETFQRLNGKFLRDVLFGDWNNHLMVRAKQLGFDPEGYFGIILLRPGIEEAEISLNAAFPANNLSELIRNLMDKKNLKGIIVQEKNYLCILLSFSGSKHHDFEEKMSNFADEIIMINKEFQVGIGSIRQNLIYTKESYNEARECLTILNNYLFRTRVLRNKDLGVFRLILKGGKKDVDDFIRDTLLPVINYDRETNSDLLLTLQLYIKYNRALNATAKSMNMHTNTVYYRIKKVESLLGVDLNDPTVWFGLQAACNILEIIEIDLNDMN